MYCKQGLYNEALPVLRQVATFAHPVGFAVHMAMAESLAGVGQIPAATIELQAANVLAKTADEKALVAAMLSDIKQQPVALQSKLTPVISV
jgi:hypothetical protein